MIIFATDLHFKEYQIRLSRSRCGDARAINALHRTTGWTLSD